jgi:ADP-ribosylglycohydrolase
MTLCVATALCEGTAIQEAIGRRAQSLGPDEERWSCNSGDSKAATSPRALARAAAVGAWCHRLTPERAAEVAAAEAETTHPHEPCPSATAAYAAAVAFLVAQPQDVRRHEHAFETARFVAETVRRSEAVTAWLDSAASAAGGGGGAPCGGLFSMMFGPLGAAFCLAFVHLLRRTPFAKAMEETAMAGPNAELNCAVVGGILGALWGAWAIPPCWTSAVTSHSTQLTGPVRPDWLHPRNIDSLAASFISKAPSS